MAAWSRQGSQPGRQERRSRNLCTATDRPTRRVALAGMLFAGGSSAEPDVPGTDRRLCRIVVPNGPVTEQAIAAARLGLQAGLDTEPSALRTAPA